MKNLIFFFLFFFSTSLFCQTVDWQRLKETALEIPKDYEKIEPEIIQLIDWLGNHSLDHEKRITANAHFVKWISGSSNVTVELNPFILDYSKKNTDFMILFMAGWSKYILENPNNKKDNIKANLAGFNYFLDFYEKGKDFGVKKDRKVAKLIKKRKAGKLENFIVKKGY
ncbi:MAG: hypothetical protein AB8H03_20250 [Saprospiraceae bacterium]